MCWRFQDPEIGNMWHFLGPEIAKMVDRSYIAGSETLLSGTLEGEMHGRLARGWSLAMI